MSARVIQGSFLGGQPRLTALSQPKTLVTLPIQTKTGMRPPGPPAPAFAGHPATVQRHGTAESLPIDPSRLGLLSAGGKPLPEGVRARMEVAFGADFSHVRVHTGPQAERIGAVAFTAGNDIYFAPGRFQPDTLQGKRLLGHELAHVVQQRTGRVRNPTGFGVAVVLDPALEAEADRLGMRAAMHRVAVQPKREFGMVQRSALTPMASPVASGPGRDRMTANPAHRSSPSIGGTRPLAFATNGRPFHPGSLIQRNIDSTNFEKSGARSPLYFVDPHSRRALYGRQGAPDPRPTGLYKKTREYDVGLQQQLHKWVPNVRFLTHLERKVDIVGDKLVYRAESGLEGEVDLTSLRQYVEDVAVREGETPTIGVLGKNDCVQFATLLYNLIAQEGLDFNEDKEQLKESVKRYTEKFPRIKVGEMMKHFFSEKGATCNYHGATVVAVDNKALVTLEGNVDKEDITAPEFHIHKGVAAFARSNIGSTGAKEGDPIEIVTHQGGNPEWNDARPASFRYQALVDPSKDGINRTYTYYSNNIGATRTRYYYDNRIPQIIGQILSSSSEGFWKDQTPFGTAPPDGIVSMRQLIKRDFDRAVRAGAQKGLGPCPFSRSRLTHAFYVLLRRYAHCGERELPEICVRFERFLQEVESHRVDYAYPGHQW